MLHLVLMITALSMHGPSEMTLLAGWELYLARAAFLNGEVRFKLHIDSHAEPYSDNLSRYGQREGFGFAEHHYRGKTKRSEAQGFNPEYDFSVGQDLASNKWRLVGTHPPDSKGPERTRVANQLDSLKGIMFRLSNAQEHLATDFRANKFQLTAPKVSPDGQWLDVEFQATEFNPGKRRLTRAGTLRCQNLPPYYLPVRCEFRSAYPDPALAQGGTREGTHVHVFEYDHSNPLPRLVVARRSRSVPGLKAHSRVDETFEFSLSADSPPPERFYLTYYGLVEPHGIIAPTPPTPYWLYGTLGSVAVIILGILLMRWAQRRSVEAR